jgi:AcrR family transcriptional regulator
MATITVRRTQAQRRDGTRTALLDATVGCLVDLGFAATTTTQVTRRAGVSIGALLHHFPNKAELLVGAVRHVLQRRQDEFRAAMAALDPAADRVEASIDLLWSAYAGPTFVAWLELWVAARTDADLAAAMVAVDEEFLRQSQAMFVELFPADEYPDAVRVALPFAFALMDGVALGRLIPHGENTTGPIDTLKALARLGLTPAARTGAAT